MNFVQIAIYRLVSAVCGSQNKYQVHTLFYIHIHVMRSLLCCCCYCLCVCFCVFVSVLLHVGITQAPHGYFTGAVQSYNRSIVSEGTLKVLKDQQTVCISMTHVVIGSAMLCLLGWNWLITAATESWIIRLSFSMSSNEKLYIRSGH